MKNLTSNAMLATKGGYCTGSYEGDLDLYMNLLMVLPATVQLPSFEEFISGGCSTGDGGGDAIIVTPVDGGGSGGAIAVMI